MKVMIDEGVPRQLATALRDKGLDVLRFPRQWFGSRNGELLVLLEALDSAVLLTNDKNIAYQQNLEGRALAIVALPHNRRQDIVGRASDIADTIRRVRPGQHVIIGWDGSRSVFEVEKGQSIRTSMPPVNPFTPVRS